MTELFNPKTVVAQLNISPGLVVADFGCGGGYFTIEVAQVVGDNGKVFAIDVVPENLESIRSLAKIKGLNNIETRWANLEKTSTLDFNICDRVIIINLLFQVEKKLHYRIFEEAYNVLKKGGQLTVIDWKPESLLGPPKNTRLSLEEAITMAQKANFNFIKTLEIDDAHWCAIFQK
ncbi:MAG: class I SAM-dependent methyltransferase [Parcubacteria group bacterium]|jgi:ubiquinone/menaquinone biosynthesis C-methylase UbiE|nr:class I SAM-dependent methyltransferase [Parcubacteria group bacterium]